MAQRMEHLSVLVGRHLADGANPPATFHSAAPTARQATPLRPHAMSMFLDDGGCSYGVDLDRSPRAYCIQ